MAKIFKTSLAGLALGAILSLAATTSQAALFNFEFADTNSGFGALPANSNAGTGVLSFDGPAVLGDTPLTNLVNLDIEFTIAGATFDETEIVSSLGGASLRLEAAPGGLIARFFSPVTGDGPEGGAVDFVDVGLNALLSIGPTERFLGSYFVGNLQIQGINNYAGFADAAIPLPAALPLMAASLGAFGFAGWRRRKAGA